MRLVLRPLLIAFLLASIAAPAFAADAKKKDDAAAKTAGSTEADEAQKLYDRAEKSFKKGYYDDAINTWDKLKNTYPFNHLAVEAELRIADADFKKREFADASDAYRTFAKLHPKHEQVDYATYRVGLSLFMEAPKSVDRDQSSTEKAMEEFRAFVTQFPDSKYADDASKKIGECRDRLAAKELYVGAYYVKHKQWRAALGRLESVVTKYPDTGSVEEATWLLGETQYHVGAKDEAKDTLEGYVQRYPNGDHDRDARELLAKMHAAMPSTRQTPPPTPPPTPTPSESPSPSPTATP